MGGEDNDEPSADEPPPPSAEAREDAPKPSLPPASHNKREESGSLSALFIRRPVGTLLLALGVFILGVVAYLHLPVSNLPSVDFPTIFIYTGYPGASAQVMASSVAAPIERRVGEIAGVKAITSINALGSALIFITFDLGRNLDGAARDVQAALNAAATDLPAGLPTLPIFRKANPDDVPILILALTSNQMTASALYDAADTVLLQRLSQVEGVASVSVAGADQPAIRVTADPGKLAAMRLSLDDVRAAIVNANALQPLGIIDGSNRSESIAVAGQMRKPADYRSIVVKSANGASVLLSDVARIEPGKRNIQAEASFNGKPAILVSLTKTPGANAVATVDRVEALLPRLRRYLPAGMTISVLHDRAISIRASVDDMLLTLAAAVVLVMIVVIAFLPDAASVIAAGATVPLALAGTCASMWAIGYSVNNISLLALATSVGFVVDDAVVMIETIDVRRAAGAGALRAALLGARQVSFTLVSISVSLLSAFIPLLWLGGITGRLFREFSVTLAIAVVVSTAAALTVTPTICATFGGDRRRTNPSGLVRRCLDRGFDALRHGYAFVLDGALRVPSLTIGLFVASIAFTGWLYWTIPAGFFPRQDSDLLIGVTEAVPSISFNALAALQHRVVAIVQADPAVLDVGSTLGSSPERTSPSNQGRLFVALKSRAERGGLSADQVIGRLRSRLRRVVGITTYLQGMQELRSGGPAAKSPLQLDLADADDAELMRIFPQVVDRLKQTPGIVDVSDDHGSNGLQIDLSVDRLVASRLGVTMASIDNALDNSYAQRQISTIFSARNQYRVVLAVPSADQRDAADILDGFVPAGVTPLPSSGLGGGVVQSALGAAAELEASQRPSLQVAATAQVQLAAMAKAKIGFSPLSINHRDQFPSVTISYAASSGLGEEDAIAKVKAVVAAMHLPGGLRVGFDGADIADDGVSETLLIAVAIVAIYLVLGVLYESLFHPLTILSTLPAAGLGSLLALELSGARLDRIALIGILLTISIVKKNGIMMVDHALDAERRAGAPPREAIRLAALERFRPILMTSLASVLGAAPFVLSSGPGSNFRRPLGITIIGGLLVAQVLTLVTTPVIYLSVDRLRANATRWLRRRMGIVHHVAD